MQQSDDELYDFAGRRVAMDYDVAKRVSHNRYAVRITRYSAARIAASLIEAIYGQVGRQQNYMLVQQNCNPPPTRRCSARNEPGIPLSREEGQSLSDGEERPVGLENGWHVYGSLCHLELSSD